MDVGAFESMTEDLPQCLPHPQVRASEKLGLADVLHWGHEELLCPASFVSNGVGRFGFLKLGG